MISNDLMVLQDFEISIDHSRKTLVEIKNQLEGNNPAKIALADFVKTEEHVKKLSLEQKELNDVLLQVLERISNNEKSLYSGKSSSSKELSGLQKDLVSLNARKSKLEEDLILIMDKYDHAKVKFDNAAEVLKAEEKSWNEKAKVLMQKGKELYSQMKILETNLKNARQKFPKEPLDLYDKLKVSKGFAVAKLEKELCSGCGVGLPFNEAQKARDSKDIFNCKNCARILVAN